MYELIARNKRKSIFIFIAMGILLLAIGASIGYFFDPNIETNPMSWHGAAIGAVIALLIWMFQSFLAYKKGARVILNTLKAKEVSKADDPELYNIIEELSLVSGVPMPKIYVIDTPAMNAFAAGTQLDQCVVAITRGLRSHLTRNEIQAVMAHEMSHLYNRDVLYMTFAGIMLGIIVLLSDILLRSFLYTGGNSSSSSKKDSKDGGGASQIVLLLIILALAIVSIIMAHLFYFSLSRKREYLADAMAVQFTHDPESLAKALEKISGDTQIFDPGKMTSAMCISIPNVRKKTKALFSTHPPIGTRIDILRAMASGTTYENYRTAYKTILGKDNLPKEKKQQH